jgi:aminopeptidase
MPVLPLHTKELTDCKYADLRSIGKGREGGACTAAAFLQEFVLDQKQQRDGAEDAPKEARQTEWAHLDIAGPAMTSRPYGHHGQGGTGFGAALLLEWLSRRQSARVHPE